MEPGQKPFLQTVPTTVQTPCSACMKEELALRKLWVQVKERAHPTDFTWHCLVCGRENHIIIE